MRSRGSVSSRVVMLPWHFDSVRASLAGTLPSNFLATYFSDDNIYAIIILGLTSLYVIKGGNDQRGDHGGAASL